MQEICKRQRKRRKIKGGSNSIGANMTKKEYKKCIKREVKNHVRNFNQQNSEEPILQ